MGSFVTQSDAPVIVAIDNSPASRAALAWAAGYARNASLHLQAVHVLQYDLSAPMPWIPGSLSVPRTVPTSASDFAETQMRKLFDEVSPEPGWTFRLLTGPAGQAILKQARDASLLVIGTGEHRGLDRLLVGSVSHYCLTHARTPVVAVPTPRLVAGPAVKKPGAIRVPSGAPS
jgi:nucleotide-binding universal stress UspA family protein